MNPEPATKSSTPQRIGVGLCSVLVLVGAAAVAHDARTVPAPAPSGKPSHKASEPESKPGPPVFRAGDGRPQPSPSLTETAVLPGLVGQNLDGAREAARAAGFSTPTSYDASGEGRRQISGRHWKVCAQTPLPGTHPTHIAVDLATARVSEPCPG